MLPALLGALAAPQTLVHQSTPSDEPCDVDSEAAWRALAPRGTMSLAAGLGSQLPASSSSRVSEATSCERCLTFSSGESSIAFIFFGPFN